MTYISGGSIVTLKATGLGDGNLRNKTRSSRLGVRCWVFPYHSKRVLLLNLNMNQPDRKMACESHGSLTLSTLSQSYLLNPCELDIFNIFCNFFRQDKTTYVITKYLPVINDVRTLHWSNYFLNFSSPEFFTEFWKKKHVFGQYGKNYFFNFNH